MKSVSTRLSVLFVFICVVLSYIRFKSGKGIIFNCELFVTSALGKLVSLFCCFVFCCVACTLY